MWNLYYNRVSVAIRADARSSIDYFKLNLELQPNYEPRYQFICGSVSYHKLNPFDAFEKTTLPKYSSFKKEEAYDFEKEFRFLIATPIDKADTNSECVRLPVTKNFIELLEIVCHPEMEGWKFQNMIELCNRLGLPEPSKSRIEMRI